MTSRVLVTPPTSECLTIDEIRRHVRVDSLSKEPVPDAPTVALAGAGAGNVDNGAHRYRVTFVTADGETDGGTISAAVTVADKTTNGKVTISAIPIGGSRVTGRNLYRTVAAGSVYLLAATIADNTTTTVTDNVADASLGVAAPAINTTSDPELLSFQTVARQYLETQYARAFLTQTWRATLDFFPVATWLAPWYGSPGSVSSGYSGYPGYFDYLQQPNPFSSQYWNANEIPLPMPVLQSVTSITYVDANGATQTLSTSVYDVDTDAVPGRVLLKFGQNWPDTRLQKNAVTVTFVAGYASAGLVPANWKHAIKLLIGHWFENRELLGSSDEWLTKILDSLMTPASFLEIA